MASPNNPKSSTQLIREHSKARYIAVNGRFGSEKVHEGNPSDWHLASAAREIVVRQFR